MPKAGADGKIILIHTSVKLVTEQYQRAVCQICDFNPHEREARDGHGSITDKPAIFILIHTSVKLVTMDIR